jgi:hypothetical protein
VVRQKQQLLADNGITIWRFHDNWHDHRPDGILYGVLKKLDWLKYNKDAEKTFLIPPAPLKQIVDRLRTSLAIEHVRVIGDLSASCEKITLIARRMGRTKSNKKDRYGRPDVLIVGELA